MKTKWKYFALVGGLGLSVSAMAQTNGTAQAADAVQTTQTVAAAETALPAEPIPLEETKKSKWNFDASIYFLAPGMSGDATIKGIPADVDLGIDKILDNLNGAGMGTVRIGYGKWSFRTDVVYMDLQLEATTQVGAIPVEVEFEQWMVEPTVSYRFNPKCLVMAGARYNSLSTEIAAFNVRGGTQDWWDPIIGGEVNLPFAKKFSFNFRGDVGGFGVGSDLTWQAFPYLGWQFTDWGGLQLGYRWLYMDYEDGEGTDKFTYDVLTEGPQLGITFSF